MDKKLEFKCPVCGGRLLVCWYETGSTDYVVSKKGKAHKNPIRKASRNCSSIEARMICCENVYNRTCNFSTNYDLEFEDYPKYQKRYKIIETNRGFELYEKVGD